MENSSNDYINEFTIMTPVPKTIGDKTLVDMLSEEAQVKILNFFRIKNGPIKVTVKSSDADTFSKAMRDLSLVLKVKDSEEKEVINPVVTGRIMRKLKIREKTIPAKV